MERQSHSRRKLGIIGLISAMISGMAEKPSDISVNDLQTCRSRLLTNNYMTPYPNRTMNQRQRRKLNRQTKNF